MGFSGTLENQGFAERGIFCKIAVRGCPTHLSNFSAKKMGHFLGSFSDDNSCWEFAKKWDTPCPKMDLEPAIFEVCGLSVLLSRKASRFLGN